jgi:hypothetical protein
VLDVLPGSGRSDINAAVLTVVTYLLGRWCGTQHQRLFLAFVQRPGRLIDDLGADLPHIREIMGDHRDLPADFTDASVTDATPDASRRGSRSRSMAPILCRTQS